MQILPIDSLSARPNNKPRLEAPSDFDPAKFPIIALHIFGIEPVEPDLKPIIGGLLAEVPRCSEMPPAAAAPALASPWLAAAE